MLRQSATIHAPLGLDELVRRARLGDARGLEGLYGRYSAILYRTALRLTGSVADAEDVVHDLFVGLPSALSRYDERGALEGWLKRITVRLALMRTRAAGRRRAAPLEESSHLAASERSDDLLNEREVADAVALLPDDLRVVFVLRQVEGLSHAEIASIVGISSGASRVRLTRAIQRLRRSLG